MMKLLAACFVALVAIVWLLGDLDGREAKWRGEWTN